jgi:hypothetical protein
MGMVAAANKSVQRLAADSAIISQHPISMVKVARRSPVPVACGEDYYYRKQFLELLSHDAVVSGSSRVGR